MAGIKEISFIDNPSIKDRSDKYENVTVDTAKVLESWRSSLFSFEWITPEGQIKPLEDLAEHEQEKRKVVEEAVLRDEALAKPVLGIGLLENIEIGIGRHVFLVAAAQGLQRIPVHIPKSHKEDFDAFLS